MTNEPDSPHHDAADAQARLRDVRAALAQATGGAPAGLVLAEVAQQMAAELGAYFEDLPMRGFTGRVARAGGVKGAVLPRRAILHRVVIGRYISASRPRAVDGGRLERAVEIALVALGSDGVLRQGRAIERVVLPREAVIGITPLAWDDPALRRVPTGSVRLGAWPGGAGQVATPRQVLDALASIATTLADTSRRDLELLQRLIGPG
ncbi:MAG TPA: hypothetical protein VF092_29705 [Longimicrobium sp.]